MVLRVLSVLLLCAVSTAAAQAPQARPRMKAPVLKNREQVVAERKRVAAQVLKPGDSVLVRVYAYVDERGNTQMPEIRTSSGNARADTAAMLLVKRMQWHPAQNVRRGVMITIPVVLSRK